MKPLALKLALIVAAISHHGGHEQHWRTALASVYGPGTGDSSSAETACGGRLNGWTLGVAHKTLRCGTRVRFAYHGRRVVARVMDRGPYVAGRTWDLMPATRRALRFPISVDKLHWSFAPSGGAR